LTFYTTPFSIV